jgi:hypothetical protein
LSGRSFMLAVPEDGRAVAAIIKLIGKEIPLVSIDGVEPAELEYEERRHRSRSPRAKPRANNPSQGAERQRKPAGEPRDPARPRHSPTPATAEVNGAKVMRFPRAAQPRRPRPPARAIEEDRKVVGFGDDLPAFLARPPRVVARP